VDRRALRRGEGALVTDELDRVAEYRLTTRRIVRELDGEERSSALLRLRDLAKREQLAAWCLQAIVEEIGWEHERAAVFEQRSYGDRLERAHRRLRGQGYAACPTCESALSTEADWQHWRQLREAAIVEAEAKEQAV
jgi:hypothetical protein